MSTIYIINKSKQILFLMTTLILSKILKITSKMRLITTGEG